MFKFIFLIILFVIIVFCISNKIHIKFKTFFKRGYFIDNHPYGIYCYHNKQGSGKTQSAVSFLLDNTHYPIYANLKSIKGIEYYYFSGWEQLLKIGTNKSNCIIFYDELFKGFYKGKKMSDKDKEVLMDFMSQMRKRHIIFITTAQEWLEIPIEFRRYVRYDIQCSLFSIFGYPILKKIFHNTELIRWDNLENEYISPIIATYIEHGRKKVVNSYDTFEQISNENIAPIKTYNKYDINDYIIKSDNNLNSFNNDYSDFYFHTSTSQKCENKKNYFNFIFNFFIKTLHTATNFFTTTIKKFVVNCHFTKNNSKFTYKNTDSLHSHINNVDNDFWGNFHDDDLE